MTLTDEERKLILNLETYLQDRDAVRLCYAIVCVFHLWDDMIDGDARSKDEINANFWTVMSEIPRNDFYLRNPSLQPVIESVILQWHAANVLERMTDHDKHMAYMLRAGTVQIFLYCALLTRGEEWTRKNGYRIVQLYEESLEEFMEEFKNEGVGVES